MKHTHTEGLRSILKSRFASGVLPLMVALLAFALAAPSARAAAPADFAKKITLTPSETALAKIGETAWTDFPVLVRLPAEASALLKSANGTDLLFTDENDDSLPFEVDTFDPAGETLVWVKVPSLSSATKLTAYFGGAANEDNVPAAVWTDYVGVWHMSEASGAVADATGHGLDAAPAKATAVSVAQANGAVGTARQTATSGTKDYLTIPNYDAQGVGADFTFACWYDATARKSYDRLVSRKKSYGDGNGWEVEMANSNTKLSARGASDTSISGSFSDIVSSGWMRFAFVYSGTSLTAYLNGAQIGTGTIKAATDNGYPLSIGCDSDGSEAYFVGHVDEARLRKGAVSAAEVALEYATMADAAFFGMGEIESVDATAQKFQTPTVVRNANGTYTVTVVLSENSGDVGVVYDAGATAVTNIIETAANPGTYTDTPANLTADTTYKFAAYGKNANSTEVVAKGGVFYNGDISIEKISDANENGIVPGVFRISRADTTHDLTITYTIEGTATPGQTYAALSGTATIPAGSSSVDVEVVPLIDAQTTSDTTVSVALAAGLYGIDAQAGSAELTVANLVAPAGYNTWVATSDGLASAGSNWSAGQAPTSSDNVLFDGRFSSANCEWDADASATVASWTQTNGYTGTITVDTFFPGKGDFTCLTVTGPMAVMSGAITHPLSRSMGENHPATWDWVGDLLANETYRLRLAVGSLTVGADGLLDAKGKGYLATHDSARVDASHGGRLTANSPRCYGDPKEPIHIGLPDRGANNYYNGVGGGAIYVTSEGAIVVNGIVRADSDARQYGNNNHACGAAGSVYIRADSVSGTGTISAYGPGSGDGNRKGTGGRVAIVTEQPVDRSTFASINAGSDRRNAQNSLASRSGGSGTVYFKDASQTYGTLLVDNVDGSFAPAVNRSVTEPSTDGDWTFDSLGLGNYAILAIPVGTALHLPGGLDSVFSLNASGSTAYGSIRYEGGTLDLGSSTDQTMSGNWMLTGWTNLVLNTDVTVKGGAAIGVPAMAVVYDTSTTGVLPAFVSCDVTVNGDLTVESTGSVLAKSCGMRKNRSDSNNGVLGFHSHGGRSLRWGKTSNLFYEAYDSVFSPGLPGCTVPYPDGQAAGAAGGAIRLTVSGTLTLDGPANANGLPEAYNQGGNASGGAGGAIDITAGRLAGAGSITANGGCYLWQRGPGGRIAVKLTSTGADFANFSGTIKASGRARNDNYKGPGDASAGTVYLQTGAEGDKSGTICIGQSLAESYYGTDGVSGNTNTTEMVSLGYGGDAIADYRKVKYIVRDYGRAAVNADMKAASIEIADASSSIDLEGHTLTVKSATVNGVRLSPGTYDAGSDDVEIGEGTLGDYLVDTTEDAGGELIVKGVSFMVIVR